jgi:predicted ATPase/DNA-binding XRE family transcriptional regulator
MRGNRVSDREATTFGQWLRRRRKGLGLTQAELARKVGCATITVQKIEADERRPSRDMASWLAEAFEIGVSERQRFLRLARAGRNLTTRDQVALDRRPTNLPLVLPQLIGRECDLQMARKRLLRDGVRLLSITGPPGVGKTTLSLHLGVEALSAFEDGAFFVPLADAGDPPAVAAAIARVLDVNEAGVAVVRRLEEYLSGRQLLLVLDNFEQALNGGPIVAELLRGCPWLSVVVTSRAPLGIRLERRLPLAPLAMPNEATAYSCEEVSRSPAVALFVERAQAARPDFAVTEENAETVARICARLGGLPLAIELVAARATVLTPETLFERLGGADLLDSGGLRDVPGRHRTMRAAIQWSYDLLSPSEQALFSRLAVCSGEFGLGVAEALAVPPGAAATGSDQQRPLDGLASLVEKSLVARRDRGAEARFQLLEPIREYALEALQRTDAVSDARRRHADYYLSLTCEADPHLRERGQRIWMDRLESERGNLQAALGFLLGPADDPERTLRLATALFWFWNIRGHLSEGRSWLVRALDRADPVRTGALQRASALSALATFEWQEGDLHAARAHIDESVALFGRLERRPTREHAMAHCVQAMVAVFQAEEATAIAAAEQSVRMFSDIGDVSGVALALNPIGKVRLQQEDLTAARAAFERSLALFRDLGDNWGAGIPLMNLGVLETVGGRRAAARARFEESIRLFETVGERWMRALVLDALASVLDADGETPRATAARRESLDILTKMGHTVNLAAVLFNCARVLESHQDHEQALSLFEQSLRLVSERGLPLETARCLVGLAAAAAGCGDLPRAARILGAAEGVVESSGIRLPGEDTGERDRTMASIRAVLDDATTDAEWQKGRRTSLPPGPDGSKLSLIPSLETLRILSNTTPDCWTD